jgi:hypothetical protein
MKMSDVQVGLVYVAKVSGVLQRVKVLRVDTAPNFLSKRRQRIVCRNLATGREVVCRSAARLRYPAPKQEG